MKKFILSFVALLAVGTMTKAANGIVDGQLPSSMTSETNSGICKDLTFTSFNTWGTEEIPIYDDCKTNVYLTLTRPGELDFDTFAYEFFDANGGYATMLANYNGWGSDAYTMTKQDPYIYTTIPGNYVVSVWKENNGVKFTVTSDHVGETTTAWTGTEYIDAQFPAQEWSVVGSAGDNSIISSFHMGGEACSYSINEVSFTAVDDANVEPKDYERTYTQSVTITNSWWSQKDLTVDQLFGLIDPEYATSIVFTCDNVEFKFAYNGLVVIGQDEETGEDSYWLSVESENKTLTFDPALLDYDEDNYLTSLILYTGGLEEWGDSIEEGTITWTVTGTRINPDYDAENSIYDPNAIKDLKSDVDAVEVARYNLAGQKIAGEQKGINIIKYSDGSSKKVLVK